VIELEKATAVVPRAVKSIWVVAVPVAEARA
jgi:hypothetical protein